MTNPMTDANEKRCGCGQGSPCPGDWRCLLHLDFTGRDPHHKDGSPCWQPKPEAKGK